MVSTSSSLNLASIHSIPILSFSDVKVISVSAPQFKYSFRTIKKINVKVVSSYTLLNLAIIHSIPRLGSLDVKVVSASKLLCSSYFGSFVIRGGLFLIHIWILIVNIEEVLFFNIDSNFQKYSLCNPLLLLPEPRGCPLESLEIFSLSLEILRKSLTSTLIIISRKYSLRNRTEVF